MTDLVGWQQLVSEAMQESDPVKLRPIIDACQAVIVERLRALKHIDTAALERQDLIEGIRVLRGLQVERLHYPARPDF